MKTVLLSLMLSFVMPAMTQSASPQAPASTSPIQLIPRTRAERDQHYQTEHSISLIVQVTDSSGKPVNGLKADEFTVLDDQKPQKITRFREVDGKQFTADVHAVLILDGINDGGSSIRHATKALEKFLSQGKGPLRFPISLVFLSSAGPVETSPSADRAAITSRLEELQHHPHDPDCDEGSVNCKENHFIESINALRNLLGEKQNIRKRTILIWTGRGWPIMTDPELFEPPHAPPKGMYRDVLAELNTDLREAQVTLDAVSWGDFETPRNVLKPIMSVSLSSRSKDEIAREAMALPVLAGQNGGLVFANMKNFGDAMTACLEDGSDFYVLNFDSAPAKETDDFHPIAIKVDRSGMDVRTATGYDAVPY